MSTARDRQRTGNAVLTEGAVARIKGELLQGRSPRSLAEASGVGIETIRRISRGETWAWVAPALGAAFTPERSTPLESEAEASAARFLSAHSSLVEAISEEKAKTSEIDSMLDQLKKGDSDESE
jgi:hypothetical protein